MAYYDEQIPRPAILLPGEYPSARPGIITFLGVCSIIIASISLIGGMIVMLISLTVSSFSTHTVAAPPPAVVIAPPAAPSESLGPDGLPASDRAIVIDGLSHVRELSETQRGQLDELLAEEGKNVLPISAGDATLQQIAANVSRSGHLTNEGTSCDYFVLGNGRLELTDDRAIFFPNNGQPTIRTNAISVPANPASTLTPEQIRSIIRCINRANGIRIKSAQSVSIISTLQNQGQQLIVATTDGSDPANQLISASTDPDSNLTLVTHLGSADTTDVLDASGQITSTSSASTASGSMATATTSIHPPRFNSDAAGWTIMLTLAQLGLAVYLMICGIFTLRTTSFWGRRLHWIYVAIKFPIAIVAAMVTYWLWNGFSKSQATPSSVAAWFTAPAAIGLIYPLILLGVLNLSEVRKYYSAVRYAA